jgi:hypothetical protein
MHGHWLALLVAAVACAPPAGAPPPAVPAETRERRERRQDAAVLVRLGCNECHAVAGLGIRAATDVAPDLTSAYADVVTRYDVDLETFLAQPTGVMRLMLAAHLELTDADRLDIVRILKKLHEQYRADADERRIPGNHGPGERP